MLCLHDAGVFDVTALAKNEHNSDGNETGDADDTCDSGSIESCDWCVDLEVN